MPFSLFLIWALGGVAGLALVLALNLRARTDMAARLTVWLALLITVGIERPRTAAQLAESPATTLDVVKGAVVVVALVLVVTTRRLSLVPRTRAEGFLLLYLAIAMASTVWSVYPRATILAAAKLVSAYLLVLALVRLRPDSSDVILRDVAAVVYLLVVSSLIGLIIAPHAAFDFEHRYSSLRRLSGLIPRISWNMLGFVSAVALLMLFARAGPKWTHRRVPRLALGGCSAAALLLCRTRSALALVLFGIVVMLLLTPRRRSLVVIAGALLTAGSLLAASTLERYIVPFLERGQTAAQLRTLGGRTETWEIALGFWEERPLLGYGFYAGHRAEAFINELGNPLVSNLDNMWIETLLDVGVTGLLGLAGFVSLSSARILRARATPPIAKALTLVCLANSFYNPSLQLASYTMLVWSLVLLAQRPASGR